ncbi:PXA domain-containing protein [Irpex rosettiformis]|uniref:PXA domain-containing protein n=1 Tax=Irpex rosettiformis TaxID=378272 RepID=A0ACB8TUA1_9APHY|nr:PXA domain-containing protein [Irpex rosettiformis]
MSSAAFAASRRHVARSVQSFTSSQAEKQQHIPLKPTKPPSLARRLLFPHLHPDVDLPPLLVSPAAAPELNDELYNFIAIALRAYVHPWWTKITRYDKELLPDITRVLTVVIRSLEARIVRTDLSPLILRDLPSLLSQHYNDYRNAQAKLHTSYASGGAANLAQLFHQAQPHMAVSAEGAVDDTYIRQALDDILKLCLPPEDYGPDSERYIIREILVMVVIRGVLPKLTQPWFIYQQTLFLLGSEQGPKIVGESTENLADQLPLQRTPSSPFSFHSVVIFFLSAVRSISGVGLAFMYAYKQAVGTIKKVNQSGTFSRVSHRSQDKTDFRESSKTLPGTLDPVTPQLEHTTVRQSQPIPSPPPSPTPSSQRDSFPRGARQFQDDFVHPALHLFTTLFIPSSSPVSSPRTTTLAFTFVLTLLVTPFTSILSRLLPYLLYTNLFSPSFLITLLQTSREALFPGGWPSVPPPDPTPEEQVEIRKKFANRLLALVPIPLQLVFGITPEARLETVDKGILDPLSSTECNTHLLIFILDLIVLTLFPEMGVQGVVSAETATSDPELRTARTRDDRPREEDANTPMGSLDSLLADSRSMSSTKMSLTPPRPDSRPP